MYICHPVVTNAERCSLAAVLLLVTFGSGEPRLCDFRDVTGGPAGKAVPLPENNKSLEILSFTRAGAKREREGAWNWLEAWPRAGTGRGQ